MSNVIDLVSHKKIKYLTKNVQDLEELAGVVKATINTLTKYEKYASVKRRIEDLFVLYQDTKRFRDSQKDILQRLKNE